MMVVQRVNFWQARLRPQRSFLPLRTVVWYELLLWCALGAVSLGMHHYLAAKEADWAQQAAGIRAATADLAAEGAVQACRTAWAQGVATGLRSVSVPLAPLLEQFATIHRDGIWLTGLEVTQGGERLSIHGYTTPWAAEQLPHYLHALASQSVMAGREVLDFQLAKDPPATAKGAASGERTENGPPGLPFHLLLGKAGAADPGEPTAKRSAP